MSRCGTVRSLPVAAASPRLRGFGIGAPLQSDPCCAPGRGTRGLCTPQSPRLPGVTLSSGTFYPLHPTGEQRDGNALWTPQGRENRGTGTPQGMQRGGGPAGDTPHWGQGEEHVQGGNGQRDVHPTEGQRDEEHSGDVDAHESVTLGEQRGGRRHIWVTLQSRW